VMNAQLAKRNRAASAVVIHRDDWVSGGGFRHEALLSLSKLLLKESEADECTAEIEQCQVDIS
jgi:hypothetical protein